MRHALRPLLLLAGLAPPAHAQAPPAGPPPLAIEHVTVLTMVGDEALADRTVVVEGRRILSVAPSTTAVVPDGAVRIDGAGRFLMPGLAEMHAHPPTAQWSDAAERRFLELNVAAGVTTVRGMLGDPRQLALRTQVAAGERLGPRLFLSAPSLNGNSVRSAAEASEQITRYSAQRYDFLKVHPGLSRDLFDAIVATARREGLRVAGHIPEDVGLVHALESGFASVEHLDGFVEAAQRADAPDAESAFFGINRMRTVDESRIPALVEAARRSGAWMTPTQSLFENFLGELSPEALAARPEMRGWTAEGVAQWTEQLTGFRQAIAEAGDDPRAMLAFRAKLIPALRDAGVPFLLGADAPQIFNVPGFATLRELEAVVAAGLTPAEALASGTVNAARFLGVEASAGTVEAGKRADLLLLDADPRADVRAVWERAGVVLAGDWLPRERLDAIVAAFAAES